MSQPLTNPYQPEVTSLAELEVVVLEDKKKTGRPLRLTEARFRRMLGLIREGHTNSAACRIEGIHYVTWRDHIQHKPEWRAELAEAEKVRDEVWRDHALEMVKSAMPKNWVAAMTYLERKYPNEFALRTVHRNLNSAEAPIGDQVGVEELQRYSRLMLEFVKEQGEHPAFRAMENQAGREHKTN